jgi:hypothetical protein
MGISYRIGHVFDEHYRYCLKCGQRVRHIVDGKIDWECPGQDNMTVPYQFQKEDKA